MSAQNPAGENGGGENEHDFSHHVAIEVSYSVLTQRSSELISQLSRMMNAVNPNDTLARRVIDIAKHNRTGDAFIKGELYGAGPS
jgi:pre-mRNA-splicing factor ATP-dependent RNA helicase DHX38/PRP16